MSERKESREFHLQTELNLFKSKNSQLDQHILNGKSVVNIMQEKVQFLESKANETEAQVQKEKSVFTDCSLGILDDVSRSFLVQNKYLDWISASTHSDLFD